MNCVQRFEKAVKAAKALQEYEKKPEAIDPLKYTELYANAIRLRVEYTVCCEPRTYLLPESQK